jgi:hypothetical protein
MVKGRRINTKLYMTAQKLNFKWYRQNGTLHNHAWDRMMERGIIVDTIKDAIQGIEASEKGRENKGPIRGHQGRVQGRSVSRLQAVSILDSNKSS